MFPRPQFRCSRMDGFPQNFQHSHTCRSFKHTREREPGSQHLSIFNQATNFSLSNTAVWNFQASYYHPCWTGMLPQIITTCHPSYLCIWVCILKLDPRLSCVCWNVWGAWGAWGASYILASYVMNRCMCMWSFDDLYHTKEIVTTIHKKANHTALYSGCSISCWTGDRGSACE